MALVKCQECGRQISDKANVCQGCGAPIGGNDSVGNTAFEKRIEQYKTNGYIITNRNGNIVKMAQTKKYPFKRIFLQVILPLLSASAFFFFQVFANNGDIPSWGIYLYILAGLLIMIFMGIGNKVNISLTNTGNIEETGNVLKKK